MIKMGLHTRMITRLLAWTGIVAVCQLQVNGQNLVPNGSFEEHSDCPEFLGQLELCTGWWSATGTCDYYNACSPAGLLSVPSNVAGYQVAADGVAYGGLLAFHTNVPEAREYAMTRLESPLQIGEQYFISLKVSRIYASGYTGYCNNIGVRFEMDSVAVDDPPLNPGLPQAFAVEPLIDTSGWTLVYGSFVADDAYPYVAIGNFFTDDETSVYSEDNLPPICVYYIDDVRISTNQDIVLGVNTRDASNSPHLCIEEVFVSSESNVRIVGCDDIKQCKIYNMSNGQLIAVICGKSKRDFLISSDEIKTLGFFIVEIEYVNGIKKHKYFRL